MPLQRAPGRVVLDPQWRQEPAGNWTETILSLRVELQEGSHGEIKLYDVEMRGTHIYGFVRAGDEVEVFAERGGQPLEGRAIHNVKTHAWVTADSEDPPEEHAVPQPDLGGTATVVGEPEFRSETGRGGAKQLLALRAEWPGAVRDVELRPGLFDKHIKGTVRRGDEIVIEGEWRNNNVLRAKRIRINATGGIVEAD